MSYEYIIGLILSLLASCFSSLGKIYLKQYHNENYKIKLYLGLLSLIIINPGILYYIYLLIHYIFIYIYLLIIYEMVALSAISCLFAAQSLLVPMAGLTIVFNVNISF